VTEEPRASQRRRPEALRAAAEAGAVATLALIVFVAVAIAAFASAFLVENVQAASRAAAKKQRTRRAPRTAASDANGKHEDAELTKADVARAGGAAAPRKAKPASPRRSRRS
jgi:hypothetical protein